MRRKSHNLYWGVWSGWARRGCVQPPISKVVFPIDGAWFSPKYQRQGQAVPSNQKRTCPRYPASAQNFRIDGNRSYARFAVDIPPFVSWILAAWTTTDNKYSSTSTTMCRFLPFVFSSVNSSCLAGCYRFHTLGINDCLAWTLLWYAPPMRDREIKNCHS